MFSRLSFRLGLFVGVSLFFYVRGAEATPEDAKPSPPALEPLLTTAPRYPAAATIVAEFPVNTFLENLAVDARGQLFINSYEEGTIYKLTPQGVKSVFAVIPGKVAGSAFDTKGNLLVSGVTRDQVAAVFRVNQAGQVETLATLPDAIFLNGLVRLDKNTFLIADSYKGAIWKFDVRTNKYSLWLSDALLARHNPTPAVNGLKIWESNLYATNTQNHQILRIPIVAGNQPGQPQVFVSGINGDDFAISLNGDLIVTTHVYNSVVRVTRDGAISVIAEASQGVTGDTSLAFGRTRSDRKTVYVVTNGGMSNPPPGGVQTAKVVRLHIGMRGLRP